MKIPIDLPPSTLVPAPEEFTHASELHGQAHVARVLVHALRLTAATGWVEELSRLWAAVYLHDIARTHDGVCYRHGADAIKKLDQLPRLRERFSAVGLKETDHAMIRTAVVYHALPTETVSVKWRSDVGLGSRSAYRPSLC